jgi:hypothetical protein
MLTSVHCTIATYKKCIVCQTRLFCFVLPFQTAPGLGQESVLCGNFLQHVPVRLNPTQSHNSCLISGHETCRNLHFFLLLSTSFSSRLSFSLNPISCLSFSLYPATFLRRLLKSRATVAHFSCPTVTSIYLPTYSGSKRETFFFLVLIPGIWKGTETLSFHYSIILFELLVLFW